MQCGRRRIVAHGRPLLGGRRDAHAAKNSQQHIVAVLLDERPGAVLRLVAGAVGQKPRLQEAARLVAVIHLRVRDAGAGGQVLHGAAAERLLVAHRVLVRQLALRRSRCQSMNTES